MNDQCFDIISYLKEPDTNEILSEAGYFCGDYNGAEGTVSKALLDIGLTREDMLNNTYIARIHSEDLEYYLHALKRVHSGRTNDFVCEYRIRGNDGHWHWIQTQACVISRNGDGSIHKIFGMDRNITALRNARSSFIK